MTEGFPTDASRESLLRRGLRLEAGTVTWNVVEAMVAIAAGINAGSVALTGFGFDSAIEVFAAALVFRRLRSALVGHEADHGGERRALRAIAVTFFLLASYLVADGIASLVGGGTPKNSPVGIGITAAATLIMPALAIAKRRTGLAMGNRLLVAEAAESLVCASLSVATLVALVLFATFGWSWVEPAAGFVIAALAVREGREAWEGELCCDD